MESQAMTANQIRTNGSLEGIDSEHTQALALVEIAAQLADIRENLTALGLTFTVIARVLATAEERFLK